MRTPHLHSLADAILVGAMRRSLSMAIRIRASLKLYVL